eukprot:s3006_g5.t1
MNILFHGKCPGTPMHLLDTYDEDVWTNKVLPELTQEPLASINGEPVIATLAEIRGDWKFIKAARPGFVRGPGAAGGKGAGWDWAPTNFGGPPAWGGGKGGYPPMGPMGGMGGMGW